MRILSRRGEEIEEGILYCQCGDFFPIIRGVPRFVPEALAQNPDFAARHARVLEGLAQKSRHIFFVRTARRTPLASPRSERLLAHILELKRIDTSERSFITLTGLYPEEIRGKLILDAGGACECQAGFAAACGAVVIAVDRRPWLDLTRRVSVTGATPHFVQAEYASLPFAPYQFDFICALHDFSSVSDQRATLHALVTHLSPDGRISLRTFRRMGFLRESVTGIQRRVTTGLSPSLLLSLCYGAIPLGFVIRSLRQRSVGLLRTCGRLLQRAVPGISIDMDAQMRVFETFQWYGEKHQWHLSFNEIRELLGAEGFQGVKRLKSPHTPEVESSDPFISVIARRAPF